MSYNIIETNGDYAYVTIDTLVKFSGNTDKAIKELIRKYEKRLELKQDAVSNGVLKGNLRLLPTLRTSIQIPSVLSLAGSK